MKLGEIFYLVSDKGSIAPMDIQVENSILSPTKECSFVIWCRSQAAYQYFTMPYKVSTKRVTLRVARIAVVGLTYLENNA